MQCCHKHTHSPLPVSEYTSQRIKWHTTETTLNYTLPRRDYSLTRTDTLNPLLNPLYGSFQQHTAVFAVSDVLG
uniref:Uncharacterized protein n=1 Tax=Anguilla anguilla TaxID=7936 RepID=A0A0E9WU96_ANGAN